MPSKKQQINQLLSEAASLFESEDFEGAIAKYNEVLARDSKNADGWLCRGFANTRLERHEEAIKDFNKVLEFEPKDAFAFNNRAISYTHLRKFDEALKDAEQALKLAPEDPDIQNTLLKIIAEKRADEVLKERLGNLNSAEKLLKEEIERLEKDYTKSRHLRDSALVLFILTILSMVLALIFSLRGDFDFFTKQGDQWTLPELLYFWGAMSLSLSIPLFINLRIRIREADETRALMYDYKRLQYLMAYSEFYQNDFEGETREDIVKRMIEHMAAQSPVDTLIKLRGKAPDNHPIEDIIEKAKNAAKRDSKS